MLYALAVAIGITAGLRSMFPLFALRARAHDWTSIVTGLLALGELIGDKLPKTPSRLQVGPLIARVAVGAFVAYAVGTPLGGQPVVLAILGALGAPAGAHIGYAWRLRVAPKIGIPPIAAALVEDVVAIVLAYVLICRNAG